MIKVFFYGFIIFSACLSSSMTNLNAQELYRHSNYIIKLSTDSLGQIIFRDSDKGIFLRGNGEDVSAIIHTDDQNQDSIDFWKCPLKREVNVKKFIFSNSASWALTDSSLIKDCSDENHLFSFELNDILIFNDHLLIASRETGLWIKQADAFKRLYYPGIEFPSDVKKVEYQDEILWMLRENGSLLAFNRAKIILTGIAEDVSDFVIDKWNVVTYSSAQRIYRETVFHNSIPAEVIIDEFILNNTEHEFASSIEAEQSDELRFLIKKHYTPSVRDLVLQYKSGDSEWKEFEDEIILTLSSPGLSNLLIRSGTQKIGFTNHYNILIHTNQKISLSYWPYLFAFMALLFILAGVGYVKSNYSNKKLIDRRSQLELKLDLLETQQRLKQAQMNPHLLFNALNALKGLVVTGEKSKAAAGIDNFAKLMRAMLDDLDKERISIGEEIDFIEAYIKLEKAIRPFDFDYKISSFVVDKFIAPLMVQPFVENAVIHGLANVESNAFLKIDFTEEKFYIRIAIENTGRGIKEFNKIDSEYKSRASDIFIERCNKLDKWKKKVPLQYEEIIDDKNGISGTRCILHIPKL